MQALPHHIILSVTQRTPDILTRVWWIVAPVAGGPLEKKKESKLGITAKKGQGGVEFADWYTQVCTVSEMISYYDVSGRILYFI